MTVAEASLARVVPSRKIFHYLDSLLGLAGSAAVYLAISLASEGIKLGAKEANLLLVVIVEGYILHRCSNARLA